MKTLDLTLPTRAEDLALDEALLDDVSEAGERLRFWQADRPAVILGRASRVAEEVDVDFCRGSHVPILRRCSGGATVVIGPGCLMYAVALSAGERPELTVVDAAHRLVINKIQSALSGSGLPVRSDGTCDLVLDGRKFSGNALRCKKEGVLYHGTLLYDADLDFIARCLKMPPRQPEYRERRSHLDFLVNLPLSAEAMRSLIADAWQVSGATEEWPEASVRTLVEARYSQEAWHFAR